jgi:hypothetical protein
LNRAPVPRAKSRRRKQNTTSKKEARHRNQTNYKTIFLSHDYSAQTLTTKSIPGTDWYQQRRNALRSAFISHRFREARGGRNEGRETE